jgi:allophanate hydrolase
LPTTAACPSYAYEPEADSEVVRRLRQAGAIVVGKTNMDQFATGLVGTRSPYGPVSSVFDERYISGGSSSGSAVAVAAGQVSFSLGTDTAGSGRVPAALNNVLGLKPTRGLLSTRGVIPACRTLDCVSVFALSAQDAASVLAVVAGFDEQDAFCRQADWRALPTDRVRLGVPKPGDLEFFGDSEARSAFERAMKTLETLSAAIVPIDFSPFRDAARLLYSGPWLAERYAAVGEFLERGEEGLDPTVREIILAGKRLEASAAFEGFYELQQLRRAAEAQWRKMDILVLPTVGTTFTKQAVTRRPIELNTQLGHYTNFVNLMDLAAVAVPTGFRADRLPFGITLLGPAFCDRGLLHWASRIHLAANVTMGASKEHPPPFQVESEAPDGVELAVVGAHLAGQPLNHELTTRGARLVRRCRSARGYRLYALAGTTVAKPALVRDPSHVGPGIELETWRLAPEAFASFVAGIPAPLGVGQIELEDGAEVCGFICEPGALRGAQEITSFGGWRAYLERRADVAKI